MNKLTIFLILILISSHNVISDGIDLELHVQISTLKEAKEPTPFGSLLLFSYKTDKPARYVGIAFDHEEFRTVHVFDKNPHDVFILPLTIPNSKNIQYRLVVDGLWIPDPMNPNTTLDQEGNTLSVYRNNKPAERLQASPTIHPDGSVEFTFYHSPKAQISLAGDFNNWDPFMHGLEEIEPGVYSLHIRIPRGTYSYTYIINGTRVVDGLNPLMQAERDGEIASIFTIP